MSFITTTYTAVPTEPITDGLINSGAPVKDSFDTVNTFVGAIDDQRALAVQTTTYSIVANRDIINLCSTAGGDFASILPEGVNHTTQPIFIKKVGADFNTLTISIAGSSTDRIDLPWASLTTPIATTLTLAIPGEFVALYPILVSGVYYWYPVHYHLPTGLLNANVRSTANQIAVASGTIVAFNTELKDPSDSWNNSTYTYTAKVAGVYNFMGHILVKGSVATGLQGTLRQFDVSNTQLQGIRCGFLETTSAAQFFSLAISQKLTMAVGDYANIIGSVGSGTISIYGNASVTDNFTNLGISLENRV
jgi:hypothetical protein